MGGKEGNEPFHADGKTDPWDLWAAKIRNEAIVASSSGHRVVCTEVMSNHLKGGPHIVVESPDHVRVDHVGGSKPLQI